MLSRAFTKPRKSPREGDHSLRSVSLSEYDDCFIRFMEDLPLIFCDDRSDHDDDDRGRGSYYMTTLRGVLRASVGVIGESRLGLTEKVVMWGGRVCAVKRFRQVFVGRREFGRRTERLAQVSRGCKYLVPVTAYLYSKRIKFVVCDYYPMGTLADLLAGSRELGHTTLEWKMRRKIILHIAKAIDFIHSQSPPQDKLLQLNFHGNIKASNVMVNVDFTACLSDYGFTQLAEPVGVSGNGHRKPPTLLPENIYCDMLCQKSDVYNFGIILLDMLGGPRAQGLMKCLVERRDEIRKGKSDFFEISVEGKEKWQALDVLDIALACTSKSPDARPSMDQIVSYLEDVLSSK